MCALLTLEKLLEFIFIVASSQQLIDDISWLIQRLALRELLLLQFTLRQRPEEQGRLLVYCR